jgi:signal transduction histidine kinase
MESLTMESLTIEERLAAAQKTVAALMRRVEDKVACGYSAFAVLEQNIALERVVAEKTRQVVAQREELQRALANLKSAQSELLHASKLESVGRLAAGIAHEINTPIQFVSDSVHFLRDGFGTLVPLVRRYRELRAAAAAGPVDPSLLDELERAEEEADLDYLLENAPKAFDRSLEGLGRVATLVQSMKEFAHPGQKLKAPADLNRALTTTLTIARNEYKYVAEVETDLAELPLVPCHVGELNQVFLNIIVNAAHAIEPTVRGTSRKGTIRLESRLEGDGWVRISITDSGSGIPEAIRKQVFDPFFTTKQVGKGTGQGLAIARSVVVDKHGGTLTFDSEVGRGTTFHIRLPLEQPAQAEPGVAAPGAAA